MEGYRQADQLIRDMALFGASKQHFSCLPWDSSHQGIFAPIQNLFWTTSVLALCLLSAKLWLWKSRSELASDCTISENYEAHAFPIGQGGHHETATWFIQTPEQHRFKQNVKCNTTTSMPLEKPHNVTYGVVGIDVSIEYLYSFIIGRNPKCHMDGITCTLIDKAGYIVAARAMVEPVHNHLETSSFDHVHITLTEGYVADDLITRGFMNKTTCIEPTTLVEYGTYRLQAGLRIDNGDTAAAKIGYELYHMPQTNIFILVKTAVSFRRRKNPCVCRFWIMDDVPTDARSRNIQLIHQGR
ncbi:hypothetical protein LSAT2_025924 [Lamellibrachia satsuma]|nr:hypothetical protein LSAT2_025924 [Lamellibrachia satsuma]